MRTLSAIPPNQAASLLQGVLFPHLLGLLLYILLHLASLLVPILRWYSHLEN